MGDTPKLMVRGACVHGWSDTRQHYRRPDGTNTLWPSESAGPETTCPGGFDRPADERDIDLVTAWLQEQNVGEEATVVRSRWSYKRLWELVMDKDVDIASNRRVLVVPLDCIHEFHSALNRAGRCPGCGEGVPIGPEGGNLSDAISQSLTPLGVTKRTCKHGMLTWAYGPCPRCEAEKAPPVPLDPKEGEE